MPSESEPGHVEPVLGAHVDPSKVWFCNKAVQGLKISPQAWGIHSTTKINDMGYDQLASDLSTYVKKRTQRQYDSILLRHMDDVVDFRVPAQRQTLIRISAGGSGGK